MRSGAQPRLETARLRLVPAARTDLAVLQALWSRPEVRRFLFDNREVSVELARASLDRCLRYTSLGYGLWLVHAKEPSEFLGCVGLVPTSTAAHYEPKLTGLLEVLVGFPNSHWRRGYAREALGEVLRHAFETLELARVAAVNDVPNAASERMLTALGFKVLSEVRRPKYPMRTYILTRADRARTGEE